MSRGKTEVMENVAKLFTEKTESEKAFILGYMVAIEQQQKIKGQHLETA